MNKQEVIMFHRALIVVDMLNDFVDEKGALYCGPSARDIIPFIKTRIADYRKTGEAVIYIQDSHLEDDKEFERFPKHSVSGTWGHQIVPELAPRPGDAVIQKRRYSGFFGTGLGDFLREHHIRDVEVVGVCTNICVMDTVGGLANRDYNITVPRAGVADFDAEFHEFALKRMDKIYGAKIL
jgi:nicotinamidase-related amidase